MKKGNLFLKILRENIIYIILLLVIINIMVFINIKYKQEILRADEVVLRFFEDNMIKDSNTTFMKAITFMGDLYIPLGILVLSFIIMKKKIISVFMTINYGWNLLLCHALKILFKKERPLSILGVVEHSYSLPSAHAMSSIAFYLMLYYVIQRKLDNFFLKGVLLILSLTIVFYVGISRIYLGVHYLSDIISGYLLGLICVLMFINIIKKNFAPDVKEEQIA